MKVLVVNCGSSSIKYQLLEMETEEVLAQGLLERIGLDDGLLTHEHGDREEEIARVIPNHDEGMKLIVEVLSSGEDPPVQDASEIDAVGHRVVHGGEDFVESALVTDEVIRVIEKNADLAPLHNPPNLTGIRAAQKLLPGVPNVAVFDTSFHQTIPEHAYTYALPHELYTRHRVRRYGFHGTSHRYVALQAAKLLGKPPEDVNLITVHLGNGCSMTAVKRGKSVETSMGLTPLEGLVMGTRSGDIDPAIIFFLADKEEFDLPAIDGMLNRASGLLGISGVSSDMREVIAAAESGSRRARLALDIFAYRVKKYIGAYAAVLGETDAIVFTGGIGENCALIRRSACGDLETLGIELDRKRNESPGEGDADISTENSRVRILVIPTNEELMIARDTVTVVRAAK
ncbi:MAG: acetate kinase [Planctomycetes bacterium DG_58]|nr:MAG: acetate kinase [Planctomycetes bacterium DG_58]KPL03205.1 MAG: acetate kinase [Planctomycetes bacterium SM23_65]